MNSTIGEASEGPNNEFDEKAFENYGYGIGFSLGILLVLILITYASYLFIGKKSTNNNSSSHHSNNSNNNNTTRVLESQLIFFQQQGIDEATLRSYPKLLYSQAKAQKRDHSIASGCSICLADYRDKDKLKLLPDCHHIFHVKCIDTWLRLHPTCPNCRSSPFPSPLPTPLAEVVPLATRPY